MGLYKATTLQKVETMNKSQMSKVISVNASQSIRNLKARALEQTRVYRYQMGRSAKQVSQSYDRSKSINNLSQAFINSQLCMPAAIKAN
jgi:hypothetical protein